MEAYLDLLVKAKKADLIHDGSKVFGRFNRYNRSRAFVKKYVIYVGEGLLFNVDTADCKLYFDYREDRNGVPINRGSYEISNHGIRILKGKVSEILTEEPQKQTNAVLGTKAIK